MTLHYIKHIPLVNSIQIILPIATLSFAIAWGNNPISVAGHRLEEGQKRMAQVPSSQIPDLGSAWSNSDRTNEKWGFTL